MSGEPQRLSKLMSRRGLCSRREADRFIEQGLVKVDGEVVNTLGVKFLESVKIELTESAKSQQQALLTIMLNKPVGYVSAQAEDEYIPAVRLIRKENRSALDKSGVKLNDAQLVAATNLAPAGRLDIDSQGVLVLTQDGRVAKRLIGENTDVEKEYLVRVEGDVTAEKISQLQFGLKLDSKPLKRAKVKQINPEQLQIILREGKKRQIRRMCDAVDLHVTGLKRVRIGELRLGKLAEGEWRVVLNHEFEHNKPSKYKTSQSKASQSKSKLNANKPKSFKQSRKPKN
jgi:23S rRNA pseudouridine2604 synthase